MASNSPLRNALRSSAAVALACFSVLACTASPSTAPTAGPTTATTAAPPAATATAIPKGGSLRVDIGALKISFLDPNYYNSGIEKLTTQLIAEPLINRDTAGKLVPALSTKWTVDAAGTTWMLELVKGAKFTDGNPFNAAAVVANITRWKDPAIRNSTLKAAVAPIIKEATAVDETTVKIVTDVPRPSLPNLLSGWGIQMVSPAAFQQFGADIATKEVGTGAWKVDSFAPGQTITLAANSAYWGGAPYLDKLTFQTIAEPSARTAALVGGQVDFSFYVDPSQINTLKSSQGIQIVQNPIIGEEWIEINELRPALSNKLVRQALNYAVDMNAIKSTVFNGAYSPFYGAVAPAIYKPDASIIPYSYSLDKSKGLLQQAGVSNLTVSLQYENTPTFQQYGEVLQGQLAQAGITVKLVPLEKAKLATAYNTGDYDLQFAASSNASGDAYSFLAGQLATTATNNKSGHKGYDDLIGQIGREIDDTKRASLLSDLSKLFFDQAPYMATANPVRVYAMRSNVQGFTAYVNEDLRGFGQVYLTK